MNAPLRKPMGLDEFLDWGRRQELRYELDGFAPVAMTGGTFEHAIIQRNLMPEIGIKISLPELYDGVQFPDTLDDD